MVGCFRRFRPSPPLVLFRVRRPPLFFSLALSGFARSGPGVLVLVFALSLFFCVPLLVSRVSKFSIHLHFHLIKIKQPKGRVCVERLHRRKTLLVIHYIIYYIILYLEAGGHRGPGGVGGQRRHPPGPVKTYLLAVALDGNPLSGGRSWALQ